MSALLLVVLLSGQAAQAARPLRTAVFDPATFNTAGGEQALNRVPRTGATAVRLVLSWRSVAPAVRPIGFDPTDPDDPAYRWGNVNIDAQVQTARANGLQPIVVVFEAPAWAEGAGIGAMGTVSPNPVAFGQFAAAAAKRFSGRVRYWQAWNEPNLSLFLNPQFVGTQLVSPTIYRNMLNAFAQSVRTVDPKNIIVAGGTAPFGWATNPAPLRFMRQVLCLSRDLRPTCAAKALLDVWAHHPYTNGGPTGKAALQDNVSLGNLPQMHRVLQAAVRRGKVVSPRRPVQLWVTEFSWDRKGPDPVGVPVSLHSRWVSHALFQMWRSGVSLVTWFQIRDDPFPQSLFQSGLYYNGAPSTSDDGPNLTRDRPKGEALRSFRFPFVAFKKRYGVYTWGRTPAGVARRVVIERRTSSGWRRIATVRTNGHGIFVKKFRTSMTGRLRARLAGRSERSVPFSLARPRSFTVTYPFGCGGARACVRRT